MAVILPTTPDWARSALQGITFWIGHRRSMYPHYALAEAALVAEVCNLVHANLEDRFRLECEVSYSTFIKADLRPSILTERARADLVIREEIKKDRGTLLRTRFVIEVKRAAAGNTLINDDLRRLEAVRTARPSIRAFMFLISEASRPGRFVSDKGSSILGRHEIPKSTGYFRVRRTWKAARAYSNKESAHYACLVEAFSKHDR